MRKLAYLVGLIGIATIGCGGGDAGTMDGGGGGVDSGPRADRRVLPDSMGADALEPLPDAGPPVGNRLSSIGTWVVLASQDSKWAALFDTAQSGGVPESRVHVVPIPPNTATGADLQGVIGTQADADWRFSVLTAEHDIDTNFNTGNVEIWKECGSPMTPEDIVMANVPWTSISPDGLKVAYTTDLQASGTENATFDIVVRTICPGSAPDVVFDNIPAASGCGIAGIWADATTLVTMNCAMGETSPKVRKVNLTVPSAPMFAILSGTDNAVGFIVSATDGNVPDGRYVGYLTDIGGLKIANIVTPGTPHEVETGNVTEVNMRSPIGTFHSNADLTADLFYFDTNKTLKKVSVSSTGTVGSPVALVSRSGSYPGIQSFAYSFSSSSAFSNNANRAVYFREANVAGQYGNMDVIDTTIASPVPITLNSDNNGYPGDDAYSLNGTYIFWYDAVRAGTNGIGKIHSKRAADGMQAFDFGPDGYFIRYTDDDTIAALMNNTRYFSGSQSPSGAPIWIGDLEKVDLTNNTRTKIADQITFVEVLPNSRSTILYSRIDGVYLCKDFTSATPCTP